MSLHCGSPACARVLGLQSYVADDRGGCFVLEMVHVTDDAPQLLSRAAHGPLAERG
jgi:hypothetical protein